MAHLGLGVLFGGLVLCGAENTIPNKRKGALCKFQGCSRPVLFFLFFFSRTQWTTKHANAHIRTLSLQRAYKTFNGGAICALLQCSVIVPHNIALQLCFHRVLMACLRTLWGNFWENQCAVPPPYTSSKWLLLGGALCKQSKRLGTTFRREPQGNLG